MKCQWIVALPSIRKSFFYQGASTALEQVVESDANPVMGPGAGTAPLTAGTGLQTSSTSSHQHSCCLLDRSQCGASFNFPCLAYLLEYRILTDAEDDWGKGPTCSSYSCRSPETRDNPATQGTTALLLWASISLQHNSSFSLSSPLGSPGTSPDVLTAPAPSLSAQGRQWHCWTAAADMQSCSLQLLKYL